MISTQFYEGNGAKREITTAITTSSKSVCFFKAFVNVGTKR